MLRTAHIDDFFCAWLTLLVAVSLSCQRRAPLVVKDSEGRSYTVKCDQAESTCRLGPAAGGEPVAGSRPVLKAEGRVLGACDAFGAEATVHPADCRALVCARDADCPQVHGAATGTCIDGLCVDAAQAIAPGDSVMLCLAGTGPGHAAPRQVERYALGLNCGSPCVVPSPCRQP